MLFMMKIKMVYGSSSFRFIVDKDGNRFNFLGNQQKIALLF